MGPPRRSQHRSPRLLLQHKRDQVGDIFFGKLLFILLRHDIREALNHVSARVHDRLVQIFLSRHPLDARLGSLTQAGQRRARAVLRAVAAGAVLREQRLARRRIPTRDRPYERDMDRAYIQELNNAYDLFFAQPRWQPNLLTIDTDDLNIISCQADLDYIIARIRQALRLAPFQESLPL